MQEKMRPKFLELFVLAPKMSITAKVSILHRISGFILFLSIPFVLYIFNQSLISPYFYTLLHDLLAIVIVKIAFIVFMGMFFYHICAGIRFLLIDMHLGVSRNKSKIYAYVVMFISLLITVIFGVLIW